VRRREVLDRKRIPKRLETYVSDQWPGANESERVSAFKSARVEWADAHDLLSLPGDDEIRVPDEPWDESLI
jgi:hypothetical protein